MLTGRLRCLAELDVFGEANAVGRGENPVETDLLRISDGLEVIRRERRLTAGEENDHLASWFERNSTVQDRFRVFKCRFVNVANLVCVHEARIAHHVATVGQVDSQHRAAAKLDVGSPVTMHVFVFGGAEVATEEERLDAFEKRGIRRHHVFKLAVLRTVLAHHDLTVVFNDLRFDLTRMLVHESLECDLTADDGVANFFYTGGTKTVGLARETKRRSGAFVGFEKWTGRPVWTNGFAFGQPLVD